MIRNCVGDGVAVDDAAGKPDDEATVQLVAPVVAIDADVPTWVTATVPPVVNVIVPVLEIVPDDGVPAEYWIRA
jgi:hypothetical protein